MKSERPFGDKIRLLRLEQRITLREAAPSIGISTMFLSELESGVKFPSQEKLQKIADFYHVNKEELEVLITKQKIFRELNEEHNEDDRLHAARSILTVDDEKLNEIFRILNK